MALNKTRSGESRATPPAEVASLRNDALDAHFSGFKPSPPPNPRQTAFDIATAYLRSKGIAGNPDEIFLTKHNHGLNTKVMSMTDMVLKDRQDQFQDHDWGLIQTDLSDSSGKSIAGLSSRDFESHVWHSHADEIYNRQVNEYFGGQKEPLAQGMRAGMTKTLSRQTHEGSLSPEGADIVSRGLGVGPYTDWDKRSLNSILQPKADSGVTVQPLKISHAVSTRAFLFTENASGKTVMYLPGNSSPFHELGSQNEIRDWFAKNVVNGGEHVRSQFLTYFPEDAAKYVSIAYNNIGYDSRRVHMDDYFPRPLAGKALKGDATEGMIESLKQEAITAGKEEITSNAEWRRDQAIKVLGAVSMLLAPIAAVVPFMEGAVAAAVGTYLLATEVGANVAQAGIGMYQALAGRSSEEQSEGKNNIAYGFLNAAQYLVGSEAHLAGAPHAGAPGKHGTAHELPLPDGVFTGVPQAEPPSPSSDTPAKKPSMETRPAPPPTSLPHPAKIDEKDLVPASNGTYAGKDGGQYVRMDGNVYRVTRDPLSKSLKIVDPDNPYGFSNGTYIAQTVDGSWKTAGSEGLSGGGIGSSKVSSMDKMIGEHVIDEFIHTKEVSPKELNDADREAFANNLSSLSRRSNAEEYPHVLEYVEADREGYKDTIRAGKSTPATQKFLSEFDSLNSYSGTSYRSTYVTPAVAKDLEKANGVVFSDKAPQSASTEKINVSGWDQWAQTSRFTSGHNVKAVFVFDTSVPQKNLSTNFLTDHVAVVPNARLKVAATRRDGNTLFVYFVNAGPGAGKTKPIYT